MGKQMQGNESRDIEKDNRGKGRKVDVKEGDQWEEEEEKGESAGEEKKVR